MRHALHKSDLLLCPHGLGVHHNRLWQIGTPVNVLVFTRAVCHRRMEEFLTYNQSWVHASDNARVLERTHSLEEAKSICYARGVGIVQTQDSAEFAVVDSFARCGASECTERAGEP